MNLCGRQALLVKAWVRQALLLIALGFPRNEQPSLVRWFLALWRDVSARTIRDFCGQTNRFT